MLRVVSRLRSSPLLQLGHAIRHFASAAAAVPTTPLFPRLKEVAPGATIAELARPAANVFYVDKSHVLPILETTARITALLRPQRWGKTTVLQMVGAYYDVANKDKPVVTIPGGNTPLAHSFSILHFDLAEVARAVAFTGTEEKMRQATRAALDSAVHEAAFGFIERYPAAGPAIHMALPPKLLLLQLASWAAKQGAPLYVLVDEYDALLRTLAITSGDHAAETLAGRQGPLREFFGRFKALHDGGLLPRMFITGISPVALDAMTAAFNCATNVSEMEEFNSAIGFTEEDVRRAVVECLGYPVGSPEQQHIVDTLRLWGNGYRFAAMLDSAAGMFQTVMVTELLTAIRCKKSQAPLERWLRSWVPSGAVGTEPEKQLLAYFTRCGAMDTLLPKLVSSDKQPISTPIPLGSLGVEQQLEVVRIPAASSRDAVLLSNWAHADAGQEQGDGGSTSAAPPAAAAVALSDAEQTLVRTLYFEGLVTHADDAAGGLRVPNQAMRGRFVERFAAFLAADPQVPRAVDAFLLHRETALLQAALADVCRHALSYDVLRTWYEYHCAERLRLLLSATSSTSFRWRWEEPMRRVSADRRKDYHGFAEIVGRSGARTMIIEVKQVNVVWDLNHSNDSELQKLIDSIPDQVQPRQLAAAQALACLSEEQLLRVPITKLITESDGAKARRHLTVAKLQAEAAEQVQEYARGFQLDNAHQPSSSVELYTAIAAGPLRWLVQRVPLQP